MTYFAIGHSTRCFGYVQDWVEKKVRRHLMRARKRKGFGWKRWSRRWLYDTLGLFGHYRVHRPEAATVESAPGLIGRITLGMKRAGVRSVREIRMLRTTWRKLETELRDGLRHRQMAKAAGQLRLPRPCGYRASFRPYRRAATGTEPWRGVRHRHGESRREQLPHPPTAPRQSPTLLQ